MGEAISGGGGNVEAVQEIDSLVQIGSRHAGSDAERRAGRRLAARLGEMGREAVVEPIRVRPAWALTHLLHAIAAVVGSVVAVYAPVVGLGIVAAALVSTFGDLTGTFELARRVTGVRASQNLVSDEDTGKPGLLILVAHYDAPRAGALTEPRLRLWPLVLFWSIAVIAVCGVARVAGVGASWLTVVQFIPTVVLIALSPLLVDGVLSTARAGANDNASGVTTALRLASRYGGRLQHFDVMLLFTGASAHFALGMRSWLRRHRRELAPAAIAVVSIDAVGAGTPHYAVKEGPVFAARLHPTLVTLCADGEVATPYVSRELSDAYAARAAGLPAIRISARTETGEMPDRADPDALARAYEFACDLVERIDAEIGPALDRAPDA
jgi:Iap family predicted aminopeptidase